MGLFRNGVQTKFYTRGLMGKEMTARLDEDLHQIIALANNKENMCQCSHKKSKVSVDQGVASTSSAAVREPLHTLTARTTTPAERVTGDRLQAAPETESEAMRLAHLDRELYPEFTRVITNSAVETMTAHFRGISYASEKKKELLNMFLRAKAGSQESGGLSETQKSDVATSPLRSPLSPTPSPFQCSSTNRQDDTKPTFNVNFVPEPSKSFRQILEETTGSRSSFQNLFLPLEPRKELWPTPSQHVTRFSSPPTQAPSFVGRFDELSPVPNYLISPFLNKSLSEFQPNRHPSSLNRFSSLLPPIEEESPEFQYYPHFLY